jgi:hypothetical protein
MATLTGKQLAQDIRQKIAVLKTVCDRVAEKTATQAPEGRWSPKEILSHLAGPEGYSYKQNLQAVLDEDTPRLDLRAEKPLLFGPTRPDELCRTLRTGPKGIRRRRRFCCGPFGGAARSQGPCSHAQGLAAGGVSDPRGVARAAGIVSYGISHGPPAGNPAGFGARMIALAAA